jgi:Na+/H+ antiporter NhaD/arsenite permease-like protein
VTRPAPGDRATAVLTLGLVALALVCALTGLLPLADLRDLADRVGPVLLFVAAIAVAAELAESAGVFALVAARLSRWGRGRTWALWALVVLLTVLSTAFLSLDTTAVLVSPLVVAIAVRARLNPVPFALVAVWLANTASLFLPVSNLTNLLAAPAIGGGPAGFLGATWAPALVGVLVPVAILTVVHRGDIRGRYIDDEQRTADDRPLLIVAGVVVAVLLPALVSGLDVTIVALVAAALLIAATALRAPRALRPGLVPWSPIGIAAALFVIVATLQAHGAGRLVAQLAGSGTDPLSLLRLAAAGAVGANAINNLPAYLVLEAHTGGTARLVALLVGVNLGPLVTPWASLATLLWHRRMRAAGVRIGWARYAVLGLVAAAITVPLAVLAAAL